MNIYARGKSIPTYSFSGLFRQGERFADIIRIFIDRLYDGRDISDCTFLIRGVNRNGEEAQQLLAAVPSGDKLMLEWRVSDLFTAAAGKLDLELTVSKSIQADTDESEQIILKYEMQSVTVAESPNGENTPLPDTGEQLKNEIAQAADEGVSEIKVAIASFDLSAVEQRLDNMEKTVDIMSSRPQVIPVTESQYRTSEHKPNALYVIVKE